MSAYTARTLRTYLSTWYAFMCQYRAEIFLWAIATSLPLIMMGVWVEAGDSGKFPGFTAVDAARYFIAVFAVRQLTIVWVIYEFEYHVVSGKLSSILLHPIDPIVRYVTELLGEQLSRWPFGLLLVGLCFFIQPQALFGSEADPGWWTPTWSRVLLFVAAVIAAFALRFLLQYTTAFLAFWLERVAAIDGLIMIPYIFLSGLVIPLQVMPDAMREFALWTPFPYMVWLPASLLAGGEVDVLRGFATLAGWIVVLWVVNRWLWRKGLKHYSAMGA
ncbi:MAG: ABC-2 family transporter protein [Planctomycetota bacterium]